MNKRKREVVETVLKVKPVPVPKGHIHPPAPFDALMYHEFSFGLVAPKGCGKTTVACNMLDWYEGYFHDIIVFSPTIESDEKCMKGTYVRGLY